jgi:glyoxylase-like metal-dependent hydrolase (beta-lactamase superfamily II)
MIISRFCEKSVIHIFVAALFCFNVHADSVKTTERSFYKLAEGIYTIRHKDAPDTFPQGNTTVIIGEREVLIVDSCYLPSSAKEDIAQIRQWSDKPVRYLVNTHWHYDHTMGNGIYWEAFPQISIIAHNETAKQSANYNPGWFERFPRRADSMRKILADGKDGNGKVLTEGEKKEYEDAIKGLEPVQAEFKRLKDVTPNFTFDSELTINLGNREVQIKHLGRGNTAGDAIVYLPKEKILISGDLVVHPVPYMFGGYPTDFIQTLRKLNIMDFQTLIPGHGEILKDQAGHEYINLIREFTQAVKAEVGKQINIIGNGQRNLDSVRQAVQKNFDIAPWRLKFAGNDKDDQDFFDTTYAGLIIASHAEIWGQ